MHQVEAMVCGLLEEAHELGLDYGALTGEAAEEPLKCRRPRPEGFYATGQWLHNLAADITWDKTLLQLDILDRSTASHGQNGSAGRAGRAHGEPHDCPKVTWRSWSPGPGRARRLRPSPSGHGLGGRLSPTSASSRGLARIRCRAGPAR